MKRLLFVSPSQGNPSSYSSIYFIVSLSRIPSLAAYHLARLTPEDIEVEIVDEVVKAFDPNALNQKPDLAAISVNFTASAPRGYRIADALRKQGIKVIIGGNHATYCAEEAKRHADSVVMGEADEIWETVIEDARKGNLQPIYKAPRFPELSRLEFKRKRNPLLDAPSMDIGSVSRELEMGEASAREDLIKVLDRGEPKRGVLKGLIRSFQDAFLMKFMEGGFDGLLRMPGHPLFRGAMHKVFQTTVYDGMRQNKDLLFQAMTNPFGGYAIKKVMQIGRGCPVDCEFCSVTAFNGKRYRHYTMDQLMADISELVGNGKGVDRFIGFADDNIVADPRFAMEFFNEIAPLKIHWLSQATIQMAKDEKLLKLASGSGCVAVFYGFETLKQDTLRAVNKGFKAQDYAEVIKRTHDAGIAVSAGFVFGLAGDTREDLMRTVEFCIEQGVDLPQFTILTPYPGTKLWKRVFGDVLPSEAFWESYADFASVESPALKDSPMSAQELSVAWSEAFQKVCSKRVIDRRLSKTSWKSAFVMGGLYFINYLYSLFTEGNFWEAWSGACRHAPRSGPVLGLCPYGSKPR